MNFSSSVVGYLLALCLSFASFAKAQNTIVDVAEDSGFSTLFAAITQADLVDDLSGEGPFTVFAPTNEAFNSLPAGVLDYLLLGENKQTLIDILQYHVVAGKAIAASDIGRVMSEQTLLGENIHIRKHTSGSLYCLLFSCDDGAEITVNWDTIVETADVQASNGIIHVIDAVLIPDSVDLPNDIVGTAVQDHLFTLVAAVVAANLTDTLQSAGPFTVLAPSEAAWSALPSGTVQKLLMPHNKPLLTDILLYHVLPQEIFFADITNGASVTTANGDSVDFTVTDGSVTVNDAFVTQADIDASNGVIHVIDSVLLPDGVELDDTILNTAIDVENEFNTLVEAVGIAGLQEILDLPGPFTVFAPTDAAFAALGTVYDDLKTDPEELKRVLLYHVLFGEFLEDEAVKLAGTFVPTFSGNTVDISVDGTTLMINNSTVINANVMASNGVIHVIDEVLIPPPADECGHWSWICAIISWF